jgi:hypothetical protein
MIEDSESIIKHTQLRRSFQALNKDELKSVELAMDSSSLVVLPIHSEKEATEK